MKLLLGKYLLNNSIHYKSYQDHYTTTLGQWSQSRDNIIKNEQIYHKGKSQAVQ
jgi:hypothetical protein